MNLTPLRDIVRELTAKKPLGQNFILDESLLNKIVNVSKQKDEETFSRGTIIEVGPGPGGLTRSILNLGANKLIAIEKDERCQFYLQEIKQQCEDRFFLINEDALKIDYAELTKGKRAVISNLPYNVGTALLLGWLNQINLFSSFTLMFQKEVAERLVAVPKTSNYGRLSIITQWLCEVEIAFIVPPGCFTPPPKVTSAIVFLKPRKQPLFPANKKTLESLTSLAFNQRRKMIRSSLKSIPNIELLCEKAGIDITSRAEELTIDQFCKLSNFVDEVKV